MRKNLWKYIQHLRKMSAGRPVRSHSIVNDVLINGNQPSTSGQSRMKRLFLKRQRERLQSSYIITYTVEILVTATLLQESGLKTLSTR
jgi:hypothetical protein